MTRLIYRLKRQDELNGFALLSTNPLELRIIALADPFMRDYTHHYLLQAAEAIGSVVKYGSTNLEKEINDISEYLNLTDWFQNAMEKKGPVNTRLFSLIYNETCESTNPITVGTTGIRYLCVFFAKSSTN